MDGSHRLDDELDDSTHPPFRGEFFSMQVMILLMEEILHLLMRSLSVYPIVNRFFTSLVVQDFFDQQ